MTLHASDPSDDLRLFWLAATGAQMDHVTPSEALVLGAGPRVAKLWLRVPPAARIDLARDGPVAVLLDGTLYDRSPLNHLRDAGTKEAAGDADLILRAYLAKGESILDAMHGEFAVVVWDGRSDLVLAARDRMGVRPLFYAEVKEGVLISPSPEVVARAAGVTSDLNVVAIASWVVWGTLDLHETFYARVSRLPPAHCLRTRGNRVQISRYWSPPPARERASCDAGDAHEQFDLLLGQAVRRCLDHGPVGVFLSGGVDSATVAAVAADESRSATIPDPLALSLTFPHPDADEELAQRAVAHDLGIAHMLMQLKEAAGAKGVLIAGLRLSERSWLPPVNPWEPCYQTLALAAADRDCRTVLSGEGGNHWLEPDWGEAARLLARFDLRGASLFVRAWQGHTSSSLPPAFRSLLWRNGARPALRQMVCSLARSLAPRALHGLLGRRIDRGIPTWAAPHPDLRSALIERQLAVHPCVGVDQLPWRTSQPLSGVDYVLGFESACLISTQVGVRLRAPYFDPDLVDFLHGLPAAALLHDGVYKGLAHASYRQRVSGMSSNMLRAARFDGQFLSLLDTEAAGALQYLSGIRRLGELGVVDPTAAEQVLRGTCVTRESRYYPRWQILACEAWLRPRTGG